MEVDFVRLLADRDELFHWTVLSSELCLPSCIPLEIALKESSVGISVETLLFGMILLGGECHWMNQTKERFP